MTPPELKSLQIKAIAELCDKMPRPSELFDWNKVLKEFKKIKPMKWKKRDTK